MSRPPARPHDSQAEADRRGDDNLCHREQGQEAGGSAQQHIADDPKNSGHQRADHADANCFGISHVDSRRARAMWLRLGGNR